MAVEGSCLLAGCKDKKVRVWDLDSGMLTGTLAGHDQAVKRALIGDSVYLTACG